MSEEGYLDNLEDESYLNKREEDDSGIKSEKFGLISVENSYTFEELGSDDEMEQSQQNTNEPQRNSVIEVLDGELDDQLDLESEKTHLSESEPGVVKEPFDRDTSSSIEVIEMSDEDASQSENEESLEMKSVVELDSEDEIENLEAEEKEDKINDGSDEDSDRKLHTEGVEIDTEIQQSSTGNAIDKIPLEIAGGDGDLATSLDQEDSIPEITEKEVHETQNAFIPIVPTVICICGDEFLLTPFYEKCNCKLEDMISLFSVDEVRGQSLAQIFQLLRGNGDLIDAYNFNVEDELRIDFPELNLYVTEDNVFARELNLDDIIACFHQLRQNSALKGEKSFPDKFTVLVSMQQRFASRYGKLKKLVEQQGTFTELQGNFSSEGQVNKKRKLSV